MDDHMDVLWDYFLRGEELANPLPMARLAREGWRRCTPKALQPSGQRRDAYERERLQR